MENDIKGRIDLQEKIKTLELKNKKLTELNNRLIKDFEKAARVKNSYRKKCRFLFNGI